MTEILLTTGTQWTVPADCTSAKVEAIGAGQGGCASLILGGAGGDYAKANTVALTPGASIAIQIGAGGTGVSSGPQNAGTDTKFGTAVLAKGGGSAAADIGDVTFAGGAGDASGAGGAAAGAGGIGASAAGTTPGAGDGDLAGAGGAPSGGGATVDDFSQAGTVNNYAITEQTNSPGNVGTGTVTGGNLVLTPTNAANEGNSVSARRAGPWKRVKTHAELTPIGAFTPKYFVLTLGSGAIVPDGTTGQWWYTTLDNGYALRWNNTGNAFSLRKFVGGAGTTIGTYGTNFPDSGSGYHDYELWIDSGTVKVLLDGVVVISAADTTYTSGDALIAQGAINQSGSTGGDVASISTVTLTP